MAAILLRLAYASISRIPERALAGLMTYASLASPSEVISTFSWILRV